MNVHLPHTHKGLHSFVMLLQFMQDSNKGHAKAAGIALGWNVLLGPMQI